MPLHNLDGIAAFGWDITAYAALIHACAEANVALTFHSPHGTFQASSRGAISGNVLLRRDHGQFVQLKTRLCDLMNADRDSLRFYNLGHNWQGPVKHFGLKVPYDPDGPLIV